MNGKARYYNTGKVLIGCAYQAPLPKLTQEGEFIQAVLLGDKPAKYWHHSPTSIIAWAVGVFAVIALIAQVAK